MQLQIAQLLKQIISQIKVGDIVVKVEPTTDLSHGDYTTNVALTLAKSLKRSPLDIATELVNKLKAVSLQHKANEHDHFTYQSGQKVSDISKKINVLQDIERIEVAPPGFINFYISASTLSKHIKELLTDSQSVGKAKTGNGKTYMVEFAHPNTHKAFHIGHLRNITTGEAIVRLLENEGHKVIRANYQGDVGMHIAKCLYGIMQISEFRKKYEYYSSSEARSQRVSSRTSSSNSNINEKVELLGKAYAAGSKAYEDDEMAKKKTGEINKQIYAKDPQVWDLYQKTRQWSLDYFESIYKRVGTHYDRYYFESEVYESGKKNVLEGLKKGIFEKSDGAVIFPGKKFGLHNRVFITSEGNPTYEAKDMGLGPLQFAEYHPEKIIHVVGPEQAGYFQVVFEALAQLYPDTRGKEYHLIYGWVKLKHGKMSSRSGNVVLGEWLIDELKKKANDILNQSTSKYTKEEQSSFVKTTEDKEQVAEAVAIAAVKYSFLKVATTQEIAFDIEESVNLNGDSGPYLLYTYARCRSVERKAGTKLSAISYQLSAHDHNGEEFKVLRLIYRYPEIVIQAAISYSPSVLCKYLYDLAGAYNTFYNKHSILSEKNQDLSRFRLGLTKAIAEILKQGLYLLGIGTVERM